MYVDQVLHVYNRGDVGTKVGKYPVLCSFMLLVTETHREAQVMVTTAGSFSQQRGYKIQPDKSVVMGCPENKEGTPANLLLLGKDIPNVIFTDIQRHFIVTQGL